MCGVGGVGGVGGVCRVWRSGQPLVCVPYTVHTSLVPSGIVPGFGNPSASDSHQVFPKDSTTSILALFGSP